MGQRASEVAREWFAADRYQDYLHLHGLGVEIAEALAEYVHKRIRAELGIAADDARDRARAPQAGLPGQPLLLRLPRLPQPRRPAPAARPARRRAGSASSSPRSTSSTPSSPPRRSSSTTPRPATSTSEAAAPPGRTFSWSGMWLSIFSAFIVELHEAERPGAWQGFVNHGLTGLRMVEEVRPRPGLGRGGGRSGMSWGRRQGRRVVAMEAIWSSFGLRLMPGRRPD